MNNKLKKVFLCLVMAIALPFTMILTGCGATPKNQVLGVVFESMVYDSKTGYAVFEVDPNITQELDYKVFPSTCSGYKVYFDPVNKGTHENSGRFNFEDGKITVYNTSFEQVEYKIRIGDYSDICIIRLKEYPVDINPEQISMTIGAFETASINVIGTFKNAKGDISERPITEYDYNFVVESADETIIGILHPNRLKFCSIRGNSAESKVKVTLLNTAGEKTKLSFEIFVKITQSAGDAILLLEKGYDKFIRADQTIELDYNALETEEVSGVTYRTVKFDAYILTETNLWVEDDCGLQIQLSNKKDSKVSADGKYILLADSIANEYELDVRICTNLTKRDGSLFVLDLTLKVVK